MSKLVPTKGNTTGRNLLTVGSIDVGQLFYDVTDGQLYTNDAVTLGLVPASHTHLRGKNTSNIIEGVNNASAVNYLRVANAATGSSPALSAQGSDTNIDLALTSKGTGNIRLTAPGGGDVYLGRVSNTIPITKASSNPSWTDGGGQFYNSTIGEWFDYDSTRSKFLGRSLMMYGFGRNAASVTTPDLLWTDGGWDPDAIGTDKGIRIPFDATIVGYAYNGSGFSSAVFDIQKSSTSLITVSAGSTNSAAVMTSNVNMSAGEFLNVKATSGTIAYPHFTVFLRRRS